MPRLLLTEDESMLREIYSAAFTKAGIDNDIASNGEEALRLCSERKYDLILLDLKMPKLDGIGFLKRYTQNSPQPFPRIIIFSNLSSGGDTIGALRLGARRRILKSDYSPKQLVEYVQKELHEIWHEQRPPNANFPSL